MSFNYQSFILGITFLMLLNVTPSIGQTREVETYYDLGRTKLHEVYTTTDDPPYRKHGVYKEFDTNANLIRYKEFKDGKQHGMVRVYYFMPDYSQKDCYGKLVAESEWKNGQKHGWEKAWKCDKGELQYEKQTYWENGEETVKMQYYRNGVLGAELRYSGLCKEWDEEGVLLMEYTLEEGVEHGPKTLYHADGHIHKQGEMIDGEPSGRWIGFEKENGAYVKQVVDIDPIRGTVTPVNE